MTDESPISGKALERYRRYLAFLARLQVGYRMRARLDLSGIVQQTLWEACQNATEWNSLTASQQIAFLRRVLAHNVCDEVRKLTSEKRDVDREESLDREMERSSRRLWKELACDASSPSRKISRTEQALQLAAALDSLPESQREALILQHWEGLSLAEMATHMNRTPAAVAGLLKRGLQQLRETLGAVMRPE